jgi:hypothetical protein
MASNQFLSVLDPLKTKTSHKPSSNVKPPIKSKLSEPVPTIVTVPKPKTASSNFFPVGGDWTLNEVNGQVRRAVAFTLKDVLEAAERSHLSDAVSVAFNEYTAKYEAEDVEQYRLSW